VTEKLVGQRIKRNEDPRLLTGQALFVGDVDIPGMLHAAFLRSDYAHARLRSIDVSAARERPGVVGVYTAEDMGDAWQPGPPLVIPPPTIEEVEFHTRTQVPLVKEKVRHLGEPLAVVIAESRYVAEDALDDIMVDLEPLDAVVDIEAALEPDAPLVHDDLDSNLAAHLLQQKGDYAAAKKQADLVIQRRIVVVSFPVFLRFRPTPGPRKSAPSGWRPWPRNASWGNSVETDVFDKLLQVSAARRKHRGLPGRRYPPLPVAPSRPSHILSWRNPY